LRSWVASLVPAAASLLAASLSAQDIPRNPDGTIQFHHALDNAPLAFEFRPNQTITDAVRQFQQTGENPYRGDQAAIQAGRALYNQWCAACHLPDATGRIGPSLVDEEIRYPRVGTDVGMFEVIYGGAAGAMQAFGRRMDQDQILKIMAYIRQLQASRG
jgi:cytochrome c-L